MSERTFFLQWHIKGLFFVLALLPLFLHGQTIITDTAYYSLNKKNIKSITKQNEATKYISTFYTNGEKKEQYATLKDTLDGKWQSWSDQRIIQKECFYKKGLLHGVYKEYHPSGQIKLISNYKNSKKEGKETQWYASGIKKSEYEYLDGYKYGKASAWFDNKTLNFKGGYDTLVTKKESGKIVVQEVKTGICESYYRNGNKESIGFYRKGKEEGLHTQWYDNGQKKSAINYHGKVNGSVSHWYQNGRLTSTSTMRSQYDSTSKREIRIYDGHFESYKENGMPEKIGDYKNGKLHGKWKRYSNNGTLYEEAEYTEGKKVNDFITHHSSGKIYAIEQHKILRDTSFKDGTYTRYNENGGLEAEGQYVRNKESGIWKMYFPNGKLERETCYLNGKHFTIKEFNENGSPRTESDMYIDSSVITPKTIIVSTRFYDKKGQLRKRFTLYKGKALGNITEWNDEGFMTAEGFMLRESEYKTIGSLNVAWNALYYSNGQLLMETYTHNSRPIGTVIEWYINGKLKRVHQPDVYDFQWLQNGSLMFAVFFSKINRQEIIDTTLDPKWLGDVYKRYSSPKNKQLRIDGNKETGKITSYYDDRQPKFETYLIQGKMDSLFRGYYPDGKLMVEWYLKNGIPNGQYQLLNSNGTIRETGFYTYGVPTGIWKIYSEKGVPSNEYELDTLVRSNNLYKYRYKKEFDENGTMISYENYLNGYYNGLQQRWHPNGQLSSKWEGLNGKTTGWNEQFYYNGQPANKTYWTNGLKNGQETAWYENGRKKLETNYIDNLRNGSFSFWHPNGHLFQKGYFKNDVMDSLWVFYDSTGKVESKKQYKLGEEIVAPIETTCGCIEPQSKMKYAQSITSLIEEEFFSQWEFPFHESVQKYVNKIYFRNLQTSYSGSQNFWNFKLEVFTLLEIGLPNSDGLKLVLNPCFRKGNASQIETSASFVNKNPDKTNITITPYRLAFKFNTKLLTPLDTKLSECQAYFNVKAVDYSSSGITLDEPKAVCFPISQITKTGIDLELQDFIPIINVGKASNSTIVNANNPLSKTENLSKKFIGLHGGKGSIHFDLNSDITIPVQGVTIENSKLTMTFLLENKNGKLILTSSSQKKDIAIDPKEFYRFFAEKGFVHQSTESEKSTTIVKLIYTTK